MGTGQEEEKMIEYLKKLHPKRKEANDQKNRPPSYSH